MTEQDDIPPEPTGETSFLSLGLPSVMVHALRRIGIDTPFPIQNATIPDVLAGRDVLGRGPTGSGKTLAFGLPMLVRLRGSASRRGFPRGLILAPTRELALQIERALDEPALSVGLRVATVVGGVPLKRQVDQIGRGVDLLVATPGRLADHLGKRTISLDDVLVTTIDEADHMAELGFLPQVEAVLDATPPQGQRLLYSATLDGEVDTLVERYLRDPVAHETSAAQAATATMDHFLFHVRTSDKFDVVSQIASRTGRTLLFVRTREGVDRLSEQLHAVGVAVESLHGDKTQSRRNRALEAFTRNATGVLVATDVAARGIHVDDVSLVVHVDPPLETKDYVHRAGRTARAGQSGIVVTLVTEVERDQVDRMLDRAGIEIAAYDIAPGDATLRRITGARRPSGVPVAPSDTTPPPPSTSAPKRSGGRNRIAPGSRQARRGPRRGGRTTR
ncbi:MAG: DEAD/DEAH box helicase [Rhodococcus sp.]|nr:DEAD/DEAH box helicase [Rhodococcus sp. (in: high G+C Gram-positive bacteria)]